MHCEYASELKTNTELCNYVSSLIFFFGSLMVLDWMGGFN